MRRVMLIVGAVLSTLFAAAASAAPTLWINDGSGNIGTVDIATGTVVVVGNTGVVLTDIGFDPTGNLWGVSFTNLYSIDRITAAATNRGSLGINGMNALVFASNGTLYGASGTSTNLYTINTSTGASTSIGSTGFSSAGDLAFNSGNLYLSTLSNQLARLDTANPPASVAVGPIGFSSVFGLATAENNVLYGVSGTQIIAVNPTTGVGTLVLNYSGHGLGAANGTAFVAESGGPITPPTAGGSVIVPTLSQWGLILLIAMVVALGWVATRRSGH